MLIPEALYGILRRFEQCETKPIDIKAIGSGERQWMRTPVCQSTSIHCYYQQVVDYEPPEKGSLHNFRVT